MTGKYIIFVGDIDSQHLIHAGYKRKIPQKNIGRV